MKYVIGKPYEGKELKNYLTKELNLSSRLITALKKYDGGILLNGKSVFVNVILHENDILELDFKDREEDENEFLVKTPMELDIIYEDENLTVVNKSANMPTHQSLNHYTDTLANGLAYRYKDRPYVFRAINRLDRNTSGVVVTANNRFYADVLASKLKNGAFHKEYIAVVKGRVDSDGVIDAPIRRVPNSIMVREVAPDGEYARTEYVSLMACDEISVLRVRPITGRTHQIRVHMSYIGHPIIGDDLYYEECEIIGRQALHAYRLKIDGVGEYTAPVPEDMDMLIRRYFRDYEISE